MTAAASTFRYTVITITKLGHRLSTNLPTKAELDRFLARGKQNPCIQEMQVIENQQPGVCLCGEPIPADQEQCHECRDSFGAAELAQGCE